MAEEASTSAQADDASTSAQAVESETSSSDPSNIPHKFTRLKKSQRKKYKWLRKHGRSHEESLQLCKLPIEEEETGLSIVEEENELSIVEEDNELSIEEEDNDLPAIVEEHETSVDSTKIQKKPRKKRKEEESPISIPTFNAVKVGIFPAEYPSRLFTTMQQSALENKLNNLILLSTNRPGPKFLKISYRPSYLVLFCENQATADWVKEQESKLQLPEMKVKVGPKEDFPSLFIVMGYFPKSETFSTIEIRKFISKQNNIPASTWKVLKCRSTNAQKPSKVLFSIDKGSFVMLKRKKFEISYLLGKIKLRVVRGSVEDDPIVEDDSVFDDLFTWSVFDRLDPSPSQSSDSSTSCSL